MPRAVGRNRTKHFFQSCPFLCPGGAEGRGSLARGDRVPVRRRTRRFGHFALKPGKVFAPRRTTRRQCRGLFSFHRAAGRAKQGERAALPHWAEAEPGFPHVVRIRTDIFLRRGKCPGCRVRWGETGRSTFRQTNLLLARAARGPGSFARGGRVPVRRRTRRFGHAALPPCSVFAPRRTTRRQCRVWFGLHRAAGRAIRGERRPVSALPAPPPPCPLGGAVLK